LKHEDTKAHQGSERRSTGFVQLDPETERIAPAIVDSGLQVHKACGPGLLESAYERCLAHALSTRDHAVEKQAPMPVTFMGIEIDAAYRVDLLVDAKVIIELKCVDAVLPVHRAQLLTYLKISQLRLGFLINFNVPVLHKGIQRMIA
jgi:GxxExxY protein